MLATFTLAWPWSSRALAQNPPISSGSSMESGQAGPGAPAQTTPLAGTAAPEVTPLLGAQEFSPGSRTPARNYLIPTFQWTGSVDTNGNSSTGRAQRVMQSTYLGSLTVQHVKRRSQFNLNYAGGAFFYERTLEPVYTSEPQGYGTFHQLSISQKVAWRRWQLFLGDTGSYLPNSPLGFAGMGGLSTLGGGPEGLSLPGSPVISSMLQPSQSVLSTRARRLSNVAVAEVQLRATSRSTLSVTGGYGTLNFREPGFIDSNYEYLLAAYTHAVSRRDSLSLVYTHVLMRFDVPDRGILTRGFLVAYGHRITGRWSLEMSAGPLVNEIAQPQGGAITRSFWTTYDTLSYRTKRFELQGSFERSVRGGSGLLSGSESDFVRANLGTRLSRTSHVSLFFGHAYDQSLQRESALQRRAKAELWEGGVILSREFGQHISTYVEYRTQRQIANSPLCFGNNCGATFFRQVAGIGLNWHARTIRSD
jgi:hypothetical protein